MTVTRYNFHYYSFIYRVLSSIFEVKNQIWFKFLRIKKDPPQLSLPGESKARKLQRSQQKPNFLSYLSTHCNQLTFGKVVERMVSGANQETFSGITSQFPRQNKVFVPKVLLWQR